MNAALKFSIGGRESDPRAGIVSSYFRYMDRLLLGKEERCQWLGSAPHP